MVTTVTEKKTYPKLPAATPTSQMLFPTENIILPPPLKKKRLTSARPRSAVTSPQGRNMSYKNSLAYPQNSDERMDRFASTKSSENLEKRRKSMQ